MERTAMTAAPEGRWLWDAAREQYTPNANYVPKCMPPIAKESMTQKVTTSSRILPGLPWDEYAALPGVSITRLKEIKRSPMHYLHGLANNRTSRAMNFGSASHVAVLEPERFERDHALWGEKTDTGRARPRTGKAWEEFCAVNAGKRILTGEEYLAAHALQCAVRRDETAMRYLRNGQAEVSMQWVRGKRQCKGRLDWLTKIDGRPVLVGLKTSRDCRPFAFGAQAAKLSYHWQWAFYDDGFTAITGERPASVIEIVVESAAPHAVAVYVIPSDVIEQGREEYEAALRTLDECEAANVWPGPVVGEETLSLPTWAYDAEDDITELGLE
jgi:hypothetical protein